MRILCLFLPAVFFILPFSSWSQSVFSLSQASSPLPHLYGKDSNSAYLYTTAGDRLYAIGDQAGNFPATGFHVPGEMGGVWQHPIKLMDGFSLKLTDAGTMADIAVNACDSFITYPFTTSFKYKPAGEQLVITRTQFVPDNKPVLVVEYAFSNTGAADRNIIIELDAHVNLMPVWLGKRSGMTDSTDTVVAFDRATNMLLVKDERNPWYAGISSGPHRSDWIGTEKSRRNKGLTARLKTTLLIKSGKTNLLRFYISGSVNNPQELQQNIASVVARLPALFHIKNERYRQLARNAAIDIPDKGIAEAYEWGKYSSDWLMRNVPGLGRGMSAGLPDYPWFFSNDQASAFNALVGTVQPDIFFSSWNMLKHLSDSANGHSGQIIHEASSNGVVYDKGRMEESQLHIIAAWNIFRWTGDLDFLRQNYAYGKKIWTWLQQHDTNHNGYIEGYGGVEIKGLNEEMLDVQVHTQVFLETMSQMAQVQGDREAAADYLGRAAALREKINADWWVPEESRYADFISSPQKAIAIVDTALARRVHKGRNDWALEKLNGLRSKILGNTYPNKGYVVYYNASGIMPVSEGIADTARAEQVLKNIGRFTNQYGLYITGIERPDNLAADEGSFKHDAHFNYNRAVMPVATAGIIVAACRYGYTDTAIKYMHSLLRSFHYATPGTLYEISPDYGMFVQAWNITGFNVPLIQYFFGIDPLASEKLIRIQPDFPDSWAHAAIKEVIIGNNRLSIEYKKSAGEITYLITSSQPGWSVRLTIPGKKTVWLNGRKTMVQDHCLVLNAQKNMIRITGLR